jgi:hypothetical protein
VNCLPQREWRERLDGLERLSRSSRSVVFDN